MANKERCKIHSYITPSTQEGVTSPLTIKKIIKWEKYVNQLFSDFGQ